MEGEVGEVAFSLFILLTFESATKLVTKVLVITQ